MSSGNGKWQCFDGGFEIVALVVLMVTSTAVAMATTSWFCCSDEIVGH
jgi:hypothetical protein